MMVCSNELVFKSWSIGIGMYVCSSVLSAVLQGTKERERGNAFPISSLVYSYF